MKILKYLFIGFLIVSCSNEPVIPKPKAFLRLDYPKKSYHSLETVRPYTFEILNGTKEISLENNWMKIYYPKLKATIGITYRPIQNNLKELFLESEKLVFEHTIKASDISSKSFTNERSKTYGKIFEIGGNAASQVQFHMTDSVKHFIKGSLSFQIKPNYDSILPAMDYVKKDMVRIMESMKWKN